MLPYFKIESRTKARVVVWVVYDFCNVCLVADFPFSNPSSWSHSSSQASHVSIFRHNLSNVVYGLSRVHPCTYFVLQKSTYNNRQRKRVSLRPQIEFVHKIWSFDMSILDCRYQILQKSIFIHLVCCRFLRKSTAVYITNPPKLILIL